MGRCLGVVLNLSGLGLRTLPTRGILSGKEPGTGGVCGSRASSSSVASPALASSIWGLRSIALSKAAWMGDAEQFVKRLACRGVVALAAAVRFCFASAVAWLLWRTCHPNPRMRNKGSCRRGSRADANDAVWGRVRVRVRVGGSDRHIGGTQERGFIEPDSLLTLGGWLGEREPGGPGIVCSAC